MNIYIDGGVRPNPGHGVAAYFKDELNSEAKHLGHSTNNEAEYQALLMALKFFQKCGEKECTIYTDSQLVLGHMTKKWKCATHLRPLKNEAQDRIKQEIYLGKSIILKKVPREENLAHKLVSKLFEERRNDS